MRKYLVGFLAGILVTFALSVSAEEGAPPVINLIGQTVAGQFPLTINGVKNPEPAAVIDVNGTPKGYVPIRVVSEALGVEVTFDADLGIFVNGTPRAVTDSVYAKQEAEKLLKRHRIEGEIAGLKYRLTPEETMYNARVQELQQFDEIRKTFKEPWPGDEKERASLVSRMEEKKAIVDKYKTDIATKEAELAQLLDEPAPTPTEPTTQP